MIKGSARLQELLASRDTRRPFRIGAAAGERGVAFEDGPEVNLPFRMGSKIYRRIVNFSTLRLKLT
jgi:hypothetical protein